MQVFLDCDGVLADFDKYASQLLGMPPREFEATKHNGNSGPMWKILYEHEDYFYKLPKMPDADELVAGVIAMGYEPIILTGIPSQDGSDWAIDQKTRWAQDHFPELEIICCKSKDKFKHMVDGLHNVLIDDWAQHQQVWEDAGGTFILHTSAAKSLRELQSVEYDVMYAWAYGHKQVVDDRRN